MTMKWSKELRVSQTIPAAVHSSVIAGGLAPTVVEHVAAPLPPPFVQVEVHVISSPLTVQLPRSIDGSALISPFRVSSLQGAEKDFIVIILTITNMNTVPTGVKQFNLLPRVQPRLPGAMKLF